MKHKIFVDLNVYLDFFSARGDDWKERQAILN